MARIPFLYQIQLGTTATTIYTVPNGKEATITCLEASNTDTATHNFTLNRIPAAGGSFVIGQCVNKLVGTSDSGGGGYWGREIPTPLNTTGDKIVGVADTANTVTITIIGFEEIV